MAELVRAISDLWQQQAEVCEKKKKKQFGTMADLLQGFLGKSFTQLTISLADAGVLPADFMRDRKPHYRPRMNLAREFVSVMMPYVIARTPHRLAQPARPPLPDALSDLAEARGELDRNDAIRAYLGGWFLNWLPGLYGLVRESRTAAQEALVKGRGVVWHELTEGPYGLVPASFSDSVDNLLIDSDCQQYRDGAFIMRKRHRSAWRVAEEFEQYGITVDQIRAAGKSGMAEATRSADTRGAIDKMQGDLVDYYEVYSCMGFGHQFFSADAALKNQKELLDGLGRHVRVAVLPGLNRPLNMDPAKLGATGGQAELRAATQWPIRFYEDPENPWPCSFLDFLPNSQNPWATSPLEGPLPLLVFIDHLYSFVMGRARTTCRDLILTSKALSQAVKDALASGLDQEVIETEELPDELAKMIHILKFEPVNEDLWRLIPLIERAFERQTGMDPLLYGSGDRQMRSAEEASVREAHATSRPDDYADCVEEWQSAISRKEMQATRLQVGPEVVAPLFGEEGPDPNGPPESDWPMGPLTTLWSELVRTDDPAQAASEVDVSVEAGSVRRPNKAKQVADAMQMANLVLPVAAQLLPVGQPDMWNHMMGILGEATDAPWNRLVMEAIPLPPQPGGEGTPPEA